ncbi:MAG: YicC/YloC family endoribonuclease [Methyloligellaceae bacterium]
MTLKSMTGFARTDGKLDTVLWHWEIRTLNSRNLDIRLRLPSAIEGLEQRVREACARRLSRGNCSVSLNVKRETGLGELRLNEEAVQQVADALRRANTIIKAEPGTLAGILGLKGVLEYSEPEESDDLIVARREAMLENLDQALTALVEARAQEGRRLHDAIFNQVMQIADIVAKMEVAPARTPERIKLRLRRQVERLTGEDSTLDEGRLYQEAVLLAARADIEEELERLRAHIAGAQELLQSEKPVGRRLEFLAQEFNREANTICSKSNDSDLTKLGLSLKAVVDQLRAQVQNIE